MISPLLFRGFLGGMEPSTAQPPVQPQPRPTAPVQGDVTRLSPELQEESDEDRSIDQYYAKLAQQLGADNPDVQKFTDLMSGITKDLKHVEGMPGDDAMKLFGDTMRKTQERYDNYPNGPKPAEAKPDNPKPTEVKPEGPKAG